MFSMLLANSEGRGFLTDSKLLKEIALNLEALDPVLAVDWFLTIRVLEITVNHFSPDKILKIL
jgi:hypothetical protein